MAGVVVMSGHRLAALIASCIMGAASTVITRFIARAGRHGPP